MAFDCLEAMPSRRPHIKSRHGCVPCKQAHVKCDQLHPKCSKCVRFGRNCQYLLQPPGEQHAAPTTATPNSSLDDVVDKGSLEKHPPQNSISDFTIEDLGLMHFYCAYTSHTINAIPEILRIWQDLIPQEAVSQPYLMHSLLALTALHKISLAVGESELYLSLAMKHHSLALEKSKPELDKISKHNCHALFAFSAAIGIFSFALPVYRNNVPIENPIREIASTTIMLRGSSTIVQSHYDELYNGKYGDMLRPEYFSKTHNKMPPELETAWSNLEVQVRLGDKDRSDDAGCSLAFERLKICFLTMELLPEDGTIFVNPRDRGVMWNWLATVDIEFISLLVENDPVALVLLAHYAVLLHALNEIWWCRGWGRALIGSISSLIGNDWEESLRWPIQHIGLQIE